MFPLQQVDGFPALTAEDLAVRKILAILDRTEGRDYTDLWASGVSRRGGCQRVVRFRAAAGFSRYRVDVAEVDRSSHCHYCFCVGGAGMVAR